MKKLKSFILSAAAFLCLNSLGYSYIEPYPGEWVFGAEYLYLHNALDNTHFVIDGNSTTSVVDGTKKGNPLGFKSAFRVEAAYGFCNVCDPLTFRLRWLYLNGHSHRKISGETLWLSSGSSSSAVGFFAGIADSRMQVLHQNVEALFDKHLWEGYGLNVFLRAGLQHAYTRAFQRIKIFSPILVEDDYFRQRFYGVGPELGLGGDYFICDGFSIVGLFTSSLLVSACQGRYFQFTGGVDYNVRDEDIWRLIPTIGMRFGLNYETCYCSFPMALEIGYEFITYIRAMERINFASASRGQAFLRYTDFHLHGPYVNLSVAF